MFLSTDQVRVLARLILGDVSDKAGLLASAHAERVAARVLPDQVQVALLHDVLEDTTATWQDLVYLNVDPRVVTDVVALTHVRGAESYMDYVRRIANGTSARAIAVKIADIDDHLRPMQGFLLPASMVARYTLARDILSGVIA